MTMQVTLGANIALTGTATQTAVALRDTPLVPYRNAIIRVNLEGVTGTPTLLIEGSENGGTSYSTLATISPVAGSPCIQQEVKLYPLTRVRQSVAGSAGQATVYAEGVQ